MASTYSTNLALELIGTGEQSGTWGTTTNTNLGTLLEQAISGYVTQAITDGADTTITIPNGTTGVARNMFIECTGALTAGRNLIVPANKKLYFIYNNTTGGFAVTVKVSGQTGVSVANGKKVLLVSNGTDIVLATNSFSGAFDGTVGATTPSTGAFTALSAAAASNFAAGTVGLPAIYLSTDTTTGLYRIGANNDGFAVSGAKVLDIASTGLGITGTLKLAGATSGTTTVIATDAVTATITMPTITGTVALTTYTRQVFLTGTAATYTTPAGCKRIFVRMKGGGGGGTGTGTAAGSAAGAGGTTIFNSINANGGAIGSDATGAGGLGGSAGTGTASFRLPGCTGGTNVWAYETATNAAGRGGFGGGKGGGGATNTGAAGSAGVANSGGGGSGAGVASVTFATANAWRVGAGGGEGEYAEILISAPAATYTYTVGAGGTAGGAGTAGAAGGAGGSGFIVVDEYY